MVGAAIETSRDIHLGCNVENDTLSQTIHAEENAIGTMIANGDRKPLRIAIAVAREGVTFDTEHTTPTPDPLTFSDFPPTCPQCLQIIWQHCQGDRDVELISITPDGGVYITTMGTALTMPFQIARL
jgi:cytidine deaminase